MTCANQPLPLFGVLYCMQEHQKELEAAAAAEAAALEAAAKDAAAAAAAGLPPPPAERKKVCVGIADSMWLIVSLCFEG